MAGLKGFCRGVIGQQLAVIEQGFDHSSAIAQQGVAQAHLEPLHQPFRRLFADTCAGLREEGFSFRVPLGETLSLEFFLATDFSES